MTEIKRCSSARNINDRIQQANNKCICEICTCGKHRCPQPHIPFNADTTNHHFYKAHNIKADHSHKCAYKVIQNHYDPSLLQSTYRVNYKPHVCPAAHIYQKYAYQPNTAKFDDDTEYKSKYVPNKITVEKPTPCPNQYHPSTSRFEGTTTYKQQFKGKKTDNAILKKHYAYQKNTLPFYGRTTYDDTFQPYQINVDHGQACRDQYIANPAKFQGKSSYKDQYKGRQAEKDDRCLILQLPQRPRECSPGQHHVHFDAKQCNWK